MMNLRTPTSPIKSRLRPAYRLWQRWFEPAIPLRQILSAARAYPGYFLDWHRYGNLEGAEQLALQHAYPCLLDQLPTTPYDPHYVYQATWATKRISQSGVLSHLDVGSDIRFITLLSSHLPVSFVDIRPLQIEVDQLTAMAGSLLRLPFADGSVQSLSCLHVIEHVGLGRYGDPLDPLGTRKACAELKRVLQRSGNLFISTPIGAPQVHFNAHRVHSPRQILAFLEGLDLIEFAAVDDSGVFVQNADVDGFDQADYACGFFWLKK